MTKFYKKMATGIGAWLMLVASVFLCQTISAQSESVSCASHPETMSGYCPVCGYVPINEVNFPDQYFRTSLQKIYGNAMSQEQVEGMTKIIAVGDYTKYEGFEPNVSLGTGITDWTGISYFKNLDTLFLSRDWNHPVDQNLDLYSFHNLSYLKLDYAEEVDLDRLPNLKSLEFQSLSPSVKISKEHDLQKLVCSALPNFEYLPHLEILGLTNLIEIEQLDFSSCRELAELSLYGGRNSLKQLLLPSQLESLIIENCSLLEKLDLPEGLLHLSLSDVSLSQTHLSLPASCVYSSFGEVSASQVIDQFPCHFSMEDLLKGIDPHIDMKRVSNVKGVDTVKVGKASYLIAKGSSISYNYDVNGSGTKKGTLGVTLKANSSVKKHLYYNQEGHCVYCDAVCDHVSGADYCDICHHYVAGEISTIDLVGVTEPKVGDVLAGGYYDVLFNGKTKGQIAGCWEPMGKKDAIGAPHASVKNVAAIVSLLGGDVNMEKTVVTASEVNIVADSIYAFYAVLTTPGVTENTKVLCNGEPVAYFVEDKTYNNYVVTHAFHVCSEDHGQLKGYCPVCGLLPINEENFPDENLRKALKLNFGTSTMTKEQAESVTSIIVGDPAVQNLVSSQPLVFPKVTEASLYLKKVADWTGVEYFANLDTFALQRDYDLQERVELDFYSLPHLSVLWLDYPVEVNLDSLPNLKSLALISGGMDQRVVITQKHDLTRFEFSDWSMTDAESYLKYMPLLEKVAITSQKLEHLNLSEFPNLKVCYINCPSLEEWDLADQGDVELLQFMSSGLLHLSSSSKVDCFSNENGRTIDQFPCLFNLTDFDSHIDMKYVSNLEGVDTVTVGKLTYLKAKGDKISYTYAVMDGDGVKMGDLKVTIKAKSSEKKHLYYDQEGLCVYCKEACTHEGAEDFCGVCHHYIKGEISTIDFVGLTAPKVGDVLTSGYYDVVINGETNGQFPAMWQPLSKEDTVGAAHFYFSLLSSVTSFMGDDNTPEKLIFSYPSVELKGDTTYAFFSMTTTPGITKETKVFWNGSPMEYTTIDSDLQAFVMSQNFQIVVCDEDHDHMKGFCPVCGRLQINEENFPDENLRKALKENFAVESTIPAERVPELHEISSKTLGGHSSAYFDDVTDWTGISFFSAIDTFVVVSVDDNLPALPNLKMCAIKNYGGEVLDFSECKDLSYVAVDAANLTTLVVEGCENLKTLSMANCALDSLKVSDNIQLTWLSVASPSLNSLDLSANTELAYLALSAPVTELDLSKNVNLAILQINNSSISSLDLSNNKKLSSSNINFKFNNNGIKVDSHPCLFKLSELNSSIDDERVVRVGGVDSVKIGETLYFKAIGDTISYTYDVNNDDIAPLSFYISATDAEHLHFYKDGVCERCGEKQVATSLADEAQSSLSVYPNPAVDYISVTGEVSSYKVISLLGETVMEGTDARRINVSSLTSGNYLVRLVAKDGSVKLTSFLKK